MMTDKRTIQTNIIYGDGCINYIHSQARLYWTPATNSWEVTACDTFLVYQKLNSNRLIQNSVTCKQVCETNNTQIR